MANPIQKNDLISDEALKALEEMSRLLREDKENMDALMASFKQYAGQIQTTTNANSGNNEELSKALQKIAALEKAYSDLKKSMKENTETQKRVNEEKRKYKKLTDDEIQAVENLKRALAGTAQEQLNAVKNINIQNKSYNELNATYNALKDSLNKLTVAERQSTEAGKAMTDQAKTIRDTMNQLQQATGNYTLNVGNYMSAFSGLQMQTQQLLREIPSAQNLQQFFLAISNNIPMFTDALVRYKKGIPEIKVKLAAVTAEIAKQEAEMAGMNVQSAEYAAKQVQINELKKQEIQLQGMTQSGWKAILKSVFSWQTAIIAGLILLRKIPEWIKKAKDRAAELAKEWKNVSVSEHTALTQMQNDTMENTRAIENELNLIVGRLGSVTQGSEEWRKSVARINELTNGTLKDINATPDEIRKVTQAYIEQAKQIATNSSIIKQISSFDLADIRKQQIRSGEYSAEEIAMLAGKTGDEKFIERAQKFLDARENFQSKRYKELEKARNRAAYGSRERSKVQKEMNKLAEGYTSFDRELDLLFVSGTEKARRALIANYVPISTDKETKSPNGRTYTEKDVLDRTWEVMEARARMIQDEQKREEELQNAAHKKAIQQNDKTWETQQEHLAFNLEHQFITRKEYDKKMEQVEKEHDVIEQGLEEENQQKLMEIWHKYDEKRQKAIRKSEKDQIDAVLKYGDMQQKAVRRRVKSIGDEKEKNSELLYNVRELEATIRRLESLPLTDPENIDKRADEVDKLTKKIEKLKNELAFDKQLTNYGSLWDVFQRNGAFEASKATKREMLRGLLGNIVDELDDEQIASNFEKYLDTMKDSAKTWYTTTKDYINDLIDAYIELANAKADAAREATEAAQEEYEKEKALLEAGYANRVETMWSEYQQKKAIQEQAEKDAAAAAAAQKQLNEIETAGSLITASANIWKAFGQWPPLAIAAIATMWGSFIAAKAKAAEVSKYGDGDVQLVGGGSHASGHDTLLGYSLQGKEMRVENGEVVGIIPRRSVKRLGEQNVLNTMRALRDGTFEANAVKMMDINRNAGNIMIAAQGKVDLSKVERSLNNIDRRGETQTYVDAQGNIIEKKSNGTTKYIRRR